MSIQIKGTKLQLVEELERLGLKYKSLALRNESKNNSKDYERYFNISTTYFNAAALVCAWVITDEKEKIP